MIMPPKDFPEDEDEDDEVPYNDYVYEDNEEYGDEVGLSDELDHEILMHRDAHFGGLFPLMIDYYSRDGKGVNPDFSLERIQFLAEEEEIYGQNLAPLLLSGPEAERVARSKMAYKELRDIYELPENENKYARLMADLILSEEEMPEDEIANIVLAGPKMVEALVDLLNSEDFADKVFPGYGYAPQLAAVCLGRIGDERAIIPLFEWIGKEGFFVEEDLLFALKAIGEPSKAFLLKVLHSRPLTEDNERAALALAPFSNDPEVAIEAFRQLQDPAVLKKHHLASYLVLLCEGLNETAHQEAFTQMALDSALSEDLKNEVKIISRSWQT